MPSAAAAAPVAVAGPPVLPAPVVADADAARSALQAAGIQVAPAGIGGAPFGSAGGAVVITMPCASSRP